MTVDVMIEIPKGSRNKYEYDPKQKMLKFDRMLFSSVHYPTHLCVQVNDPTWNCVPRIADVPRHLLKEMEHLFAEYKDLQEKKRVVEGWEHVDAAFRVILDTQTRFAEQPKGR